MTVKEAITMEMKKLSKRGKTVFLGENVINSGRIYGTLEEVPLEMCIEMPLAENLIAGVAIGLALNGWRPVCIFQRMDFMLIAADQIINHASLMEEMSGWKLKLPVVFRTIKSNLNQKFFVGHQHCKDFTYVFEPHLPVLEVPGKYTAEEAYTRARETEHPILIVEDYKRFGEECK